MSIPSSNAGNSVRIKSKVKVGGGGTWVGGNHNQVRIKPKVKADGLSSLGQSHRCPCDVRRLAASIA